MTKDDYINLIVQNKLEELAKVHYLDNLVKYQYNNKYLIEYLLENNIHSQEMDNFLTYNASYATFYLKYNIIEPLLNCHLKTLLNVNNKELILDTLLSKLDHKNRIKLYENIKEQSYWYFRDYEDYVIKSFEKYGVILPKIFIQNKTNKEKVNLANQNKLLLEELKLAFNDHSYIILDIVINELKHELISNEKYTIFEIKELIKYKKNHPNFKFIISNTSNGSFNPENETMEITPYRKGVLSHEISHLIFDQNEKASYETVKEYEKICDNIENNDEIINKIVDYLQKFHQQYHNRRIVYEKKYYDELKDRYQTYENYIKKVCQDLINSNTQTISVEYDRKIGFFVSSDNIKDVATELLIIEKEEYIKNELNNYYTEELMLENLLDALLHGRILDDLLDVECLSGHSFFQFIEEPSLSFNECIANYSVIRKSRKATELIDDLDKLTNNQLTSFLDEYFEKNRGNSYGR